MAEKNMDAKISVDFEESSSRQQLNSGEDITTLFGKVRKFFSDLKAVAFSGSYADLSDKPESLPANGGNADTVGRLPASNFAYMTDIIRGVKYGWACNTAGTVMTYGDRGIVKTTSDLSYIGWTIDSGGWFVPIIVSQYASGTNYTMYGLNCGYDFAGGNDRATFDYKNRTYYACWSSPASYTSPSVIGGLQLTVTNNDYVTACKTLIDYCERIEAVFANTASIAHEVNSPNGKALLYEDGEGGNFELTAPDGSHFMQMDLYNGTDFRMYFGDKTTGELTFPFFYKFDTGKIELNGTSDIYTVLNKPYVTGEGNCGHVVTAMAIDYQIFDFTPSAVICQIADGSAFFAETIQNGFSVLLVPTDNGKILKYIAFK